MGMMMRVVEHTIGPRPLTPNSTLPPMAAGSGDLTWGTASSPGPVRAMRPPPGRMAPGMNGSVFGGVGSHSWPVRGLGADSIHSQSSRGSVFPNGGVGLVLGLALGAAAGGLLLVMAVLAVLLRKWYGTRHKGALEFDMDDRTTIASSRSAPNTRSNTPDSMRRSKTNLMRSITMDMISIETEMTSVEAVQPESSTEDGSSYTGSTQTLLSQHPLVGVKQQPEVYNDAFELDEYVEETSRGGPAHPSSLAYSILYDPNSEKLTVNVIKANHLKGREPNNKPRDPFVKVCVLPDEKSKQQGRVHSQTLDPIFNDSFAFYVSRKEVSKRTVRISVYDIDKRRIRHTLGHVFISLHGDELTSGNIRWAQLQRRAHRPDQEQPDLGHLQLTLTFLPAAEEVHLTVGSLQGLHRLRLGKKEGITARCSLLESGRPSSCQKTAVIYDINQQGHMTFAEPMRFVVPIQQLDACSFRVSLVVMHADGGPDEMGVEFGHVTVGSHLYAQKEGLSHWSRMVTDARIPITEWHRVAPPLVTPTSSPDE